ncbi:hypothetical protein HP398_00340 [Brevibacillus sp. HB1.4B]|uniref:hypothetical protein n=1 Tax=Brevibacillus sp. HB1.4B TaxID=2738845 RepID=UPI0003638E35|nr:hypothetical protein A616_12890 [Brevibacillus brevis X23]NRS14880.1 hypothetical protein [Brevibacillus sp. HB1.4B]
MTRRFLPFIAALLSLMLLSLPAFAQDEASWDKQFQAQIREWMDAIASRDPQFKQWQDAKTDVQTLGAGQHQWLVSIKKADKQVGYLVIGEAPDSTSHEKFVLLEYGVGEYILFDDAFAPKEIAAEPVYDGFASYWLITQKSDTQMVNAKTGEMYPTSFQISEPTVDAFAGEKLIQNGQRLTQMRILNAAEADPFDHIGWVSQMSTTDTDVSWNQLWQQDYTSPVTLAVPIHQSQVLAPFVVGSLHLWNDQNAYVGVWDEGLRFVPYSYAHRVGRFFVNETSSPAE